MIGQHTVADYSAALLPDPAQMLGKGFFCAYEIANFYADAAALTASYARRNFYKIILITGDATYYYGDRSARVEPGKYGLVFTNREVPYRWEVHSGACEGYGCLFTDDFLPVHTHIRPSDWPVFDADGPCFFSLTPEEATPFQHLFRKMLDEQQTEYAHKYDLLFLYVLECIHAAIKLKPAAATPASSASMRIVNAFRTLLAQLFTNDTSSQPSRLRTAQDFAIRLSVHVNYLNRILKAATGKTTTQLIAGRVIQEARSRLLHTDMTISQISYSLGFDEPTHFTRFFHKYTGVTPSALRQV